jgi:hypothetical protein
VVVAWSLAGASGLNIAFRDPGAMGEDYDLVVLKAGFVSLDVDGGCGAPTVA